MLNTKRIAVKVKRSIYGKRAKGTPVPAPTRRTVQPIEKLSFAQWAQELQVSSKFRVDVAVYF